MTSASVSASPTNPNLPWRLQDRLARNQNNTASPSSAPTTTTLSDSSPPQTASTSAPDSGASPVDRLFDWAARQGLPPHKAITMAQRLEARLKRRPKNPLPRRKPHRDQPKVVLNGGWLGAQDGFEATSDDNSGQEGGNDTTESAWREQLKQPVGGVGGWLVFD